MRTADLGLTRTDVHEARQLRDAEAPAPGFTERTLEGIMQDEFAAVVVWDRLEFTARRLPENVHRAHDDLELFIANHRD